jgi:hypothetical protein
VAKKSGDPLKSFSYAQIVEEIKRVQDLLSKYTKGDPSLPHDFNYKETIFTLRYLRLRQISRKKQNKEEVNNG